MDIGKPFEKPAAAMVVHLAKGAIALEEEIVELEALIEARFRAHLRAEVILRPSRMGAEAGAEIDALGGAGRLTGFAGLTLQLRDSGYVSGNFRRPRRYT
ncbi:hypothetical protein [Streptomyces chryseus]